MIAPSWTPTHGETIHLNPRNRWHLPAGRYRLDDRGNFWLLRDAASGGAFAHVGHAALLGEEQRGPLTPISAAELERERVRAAALAL